MCEFPTCTFCLEKYTGKQAIQRKNPGFIKAVWYCLKPACRKAAAAAKEQGTVATGQ